MSGGKFSVSGGEGGVELDRPLQHAARFQVALFGEEALLPQGANIVVVSLRVVGHLTRQPVLLGRRQFDPKCRDDPRPDLVLKVEDVGRIAVVAFRPEVDAGLGVDQLGVDADAPAGLAHAALDHVAHAELAGHLAHVERLALVGEGRIAGDDQEPGDLGQVGDQILGHAVGEVLLLGIAAHIRERQHRDRGLVGRGDGQVFPGRGPDIRQSGGAQPLDDARQRFRVLERMGFHPRADGEIGFDPERFGHRRPGLLVAPQGLVVRGQPDEWEYCVGLPHDARLEGLDRRCVLADQAVGQGQVVQEPYFVVRAEAHRRVEPGDGLFRIAGIDQCQGEQADVDSVVGIDLGGLPAKLDGLVVTALEQADAPQESQGPGVGPIHFHRFFGEPHRGLEGLLARFGPSEARIEPMRPGEQTPRRDVVGLLFRCFEQKPSRFRVRRLGKLPKMPVASQNGFVDGQALRPVPR